MQAAGIEPASGPKPGRAGVGQNVSKDGHDGPQVGQLEGVAVCPVCKGRTELGQDGSKAGRATSIAGAQQEKSGDACEAGLAFILETWPDPPEAARRAVLGAFRVFWSR